MGAVKDPTPLSDAALEEWPEFVARVRSRLERGKHEYGDSSFLLNQTPLLENIEEELLDVMGWTFILWLRIRKMQKGGSRE